MKKGLKLGDYSYTKYRVLLDFFARIKNICLDINILIKYM
jgi:hypothetical protein